MGDKKTLKSFKNLKKFICACCDFECSQKCDINRHNLTAKHKKNTECLPDTDVKPPLKCICECGNEYFHRQSLSKHKKQCKIGKKTNVELQVKPCSGEPLEPDIRYKTDEENNNIINLLIENNNIINLLIENNKQLQDDNKEFKDLIIQLLTQNKISQEQNQAQTAAILELTKNGINNITNNTTNKPTFNLNFFLNDTCKDAMNLTDFVNSIQLTYKDFIRVGSDGYVKGISNIINDNMKNLAEIERPIHCTDEKRGTLYIKDDNKWEKAEDNKKMNSLIGHVATKNAREINSYKKEFPDCIKSLSKHSDTYNKCVVEAMGGPGVVNKINKKMKKKRKSKEVF